MLDSFLGRAQSFLGVRVSGSPDNYYISPISLNATVKASTRSEDEVCFSCPQEIICGYRVQPSRLGVQ